MGERCPRPLFQRVLLKLPSAANGANAAHAAVTPTRYERNCDTTIHTAVQIISMLPVVAEGAMECGRGYCHPGAKTWVRWPAFENPAAATAASLPARRPEHHWPKHNVCRLGHSCVQHLANKELLNCQNLTSPSSCAAGGRATSR